MAALKVDTAELHAVAAGLRSAAHTLAQLGATPLAHPALATDETSTSAAARLSEHGSVVASRATDAAAVLNSLADAITQAAQSYTAMDAANATLVSLQGNPTPATASPTPAVSADLTAAQIPIAPQISRPAETTAAIMEAGQAARSPVRLWVHSTRRSLRRCRAFGTHRRRRGEPTPARRGGADHQRRAQRVCRLVRLHDPVHPSAGTDGRRRQGSLRPGATQHPVDNGLR